MENGEGKGQ